MTTRALTSAQVEQLCEHAPLIERLASAHRALSAGRVLQPLPHPLRDDADEDRSDLAIVPMLAYDLDAGVFAVKALADAPGNRARGLPAQRSTVVLFDAASGGCRGVIDGRALTRIRTAAVTALATDALASPHADVLTIVGAGPLAIEHARLLLSSPARTGRGYSRVVLWSRSASRAEAARAAVAALPGAAGVRVEATSDVERAVRSADVVCTLTPAETAYLEAAWLRPGAHVNAAGSPPRPTFAELRPDVFAAATRTVVDHTGVALQESGNIRNAVAAGTLDPNRLVDLGEELDAGRQRAAGEVTVFNSVGIGAQDLAAALYVLDAADAAGVGTVIDLR